MPDQPRNTIIQAGGTIYAIANHTQAEALKLVNSARWLRLHVGEEIMHIASASVTRIHEMELPSHHGTIWNLTDADKSEQAKPAQTAPVKRGPGRPRKTTS